MAADLQPPPDCKKIALLGPCPTYDFVLMDFSTIFFGLVQARSKVMNLKVCEGFFTKLIGETGDRGKSETGFFAKIFAVAVKLVEKPGFFGLELYLVKPQAIDRSILLEKWY